MNNMESIDFFVKDIFDSSLDSSSGLIVVVASLIHEHTENAEANT
jgi:hypothetical protein